MKRRGLRTHDLQAGISCAKIHAKLGQLKEAARGFRV